MAYSNYFDFSNGPELATGVGTVKNISYFGGADFKRPYQYVKEADTGERSPARKAAQAFDALMAGHDATTAGYVSTLKSIYDGYGKYAKDFGDKAEPILKALTGDIGNMEKYIGEYGSLLDESKSLFTDGINIDPNATRTREEYMGNAAAQYGQAREKQIRDMASQGLNPYANKGADRQLNLATAAGLTNAANTAYKDWRNQYNQDIQAKQQATGQYAGLVGQKGALQGQVISARGGLIGVNKDIMEAKIGADQLRAQGYQDLTSLNESRRSEQLKLGQQQQENLRQQADIRQQLTAKLTPYDRAVASGTASAVY